MRINHNRIAMEDPQSTTEADSGDNTVIAAPGAGWRLVITDFSIQNESSTATTVLVKDGSTTRFRKLLQNQGDGLSASFAPERYWVLAENSAFIVNLSGANSHNVDVYYYKERTP